MKTIIGTLAIVVGLLLSGSVEAWEFVPGDVNDDGEFNVGDSTVLRRALAGLGPGIVQAGFEPTVPDIRGTYTGSGETVCPVSSSSFAISVTLVIASQTGTTFVGNVTIQTASGARQTASISGTVTAHNSIHGSFEFQTFVNGSQVNNGAGTLVGSVDGTAIAIEITSESNFGEWCTTSIGVSR